MWTEPFLSRRTPESPALIVWFSPAPENSKSAGSHPGFEVAETLPDTVATRSEEVPVFDAFSVTSEVLRGVRALSTVPLSVIEPLASATEPEPEPEPPAVQYAIAATATARAVM